MSGALADATVDTIETNENAEINTSRPRHTQHAHADTMPNSSVEGSVDTSSMHGRNESVTARPGHPQQSHMQSMASAAFDDLASNVNIDETTENATSRSTTRPTLKIDDDPDIIVISDDEMEATHSVSHLNPKKAEYDLRKIRAAAGSKKASKEKERIKLEGLLVGESTIGKAELRLTLKVVVADMNYYEKKLKMANFELRALRRSESDYSQKHRLQEMLAEVDGAMWEAEKVFLDLVEAFPQHGSIQRPS